MKNALRNLTVLITLIFTLNLTALAAPVNSKLQQQTDSLTRIQAEREDLLIFLARHIYGVEQHLLALIAQDSHNTYTLILEYQ